MKKKKPEFEPKFKDPNQLTPREAEVLALQKSGKNKREIAELLGISFTTVNSLMAKAHDKERFNGHGL
jgi:DNA-binding CsgD family transcriptional regulator